VFDLRFFTQIFILHSSVWIRIWIRIRIQIFFRIQIQPKLTDSFGFGSTTLPYRYTLYQRYRYVRLMHTWHQYRYRYRYRFQKFY
jgi:hypothetical protein